MTWTAPRTWVAGEVVTAALFNTHIRDNLKMVGDALAAYTPTYTNFSLGNGSVAAVKAEAGKWVRYAGVITLGSTSSVTGTIRISLPATSVLSTFGRPLRGTAELFDSSAAARRFRIVALQSGTEFYMADLSDTRVDAATPWAWGTSDTVAWNLDYESA